MKKLPEKVGLALIEKLASESKVLKSFEILDITDTGVYQNAYIRAICFLHGSDIERVKLISIHWFKDYLNKDWYQINLIHVIPETIFKDFKSLLSKKEAIPNEFSNKEQAADTLVV